MQGRMQDVAPIAATAILLDYAHITFPHPNDRCKLVAGPRVPIEMFGYEVDGAMYAGADLVYN